VFQYAGLAFSGAGLASFGCRQALCSAIRRHANSLCFWPLRDAPAGDAMFFLFSNKLGCTGSLLISLGLSVLLLYVLGWL
jgi:hypothetical protein